MHFCRRRFHPRLQVFQERHIFPFEEPLHILHHFLIFTGRNLPGTRGETPAHLVVEAGAAQSSAVQPVFTLSKRKNFVNQPNGFTDFLDHGIGTKIGRPIFPYATHYLQPWKFLLRCQAYIGVMLVIFKQDVVARLVFLYKVTFKDQRLGFCFRGQELDIADFIQENSCPGVKRA